jgi:hypothetical protein
MKRMIPLTKWPEFHTWPTAAALRYYVFNGEHNGFNTVFKRVGRRILIDEEAFFRWIETRNANNN